MKLIDPQQSVTAAALEIQQCIDEIVGLVGRRLPRIYQIVNTPGKQQAILDRIGQDLPTASSLQVYVAFQAAMELAAPGKVPAANLEVFVPQENGSVLYVAPEEEIPT